MQNKEYMIYTHQCEFCEATVECENAYDDDWISEFIPIDENRRADGFVCPECQERCFVVNDDGISVQWRD